MNACEEMLIACDLREVLGKPAPDLIERTLARLSQPKESPAKVEAPLHALPSPRWQRFALAASVLLALGLIGWLAWPRALPEGVNATGNASYSVRTDFIELREGALLLQTGAPEVRAAGQRITKVNGRSVVNIGGIPKDFAVLNELPLTDKEKPVLKEIKRWTVAAGVALCVLSGSAMLNDVPIRADKDADKTPDKIESPKPEDIDGLQAMLEKTASVTVRGRDASHRMCCPVEIANSSEVKDLVDAIYSDLALAKAPAGWDSNNAITFHLSDGREIAIMINMKDGLADLKLAGWERYYEYNVRADLLQRFQRPLDRSVANGPDCPAPQGLRKLRGFSGYDSKIEARELVLAETQAELDALWARHKPGTAAPDVDFDKELVLGIFQGKSVNSFGVFLTEILDDQLKNPEEYVVRYDEITKQSMGEGTHGTSYGIFVLSRTSANIHVEENIQSLLGNPPMWKRYETRESMKLLRDRNASPVVTRLRGWEGEGSGVKAVRNALIENKAAWEALWKEHKPGEAAPEVDFEKEVVVAMFQEVPEGWGGVKITDLLANDERAVLHVRAATWQSDGSPAKLTMSYGFHVFPKGRKIVLETPNYRNLGEDPRWLETAWK